MPRKKITDEETEITEVQEQETEQPEPLKNERPGRAEPVLTIEAGDEIESAEYQEELIWHEIQNAYRTRKILSGILSGLEKTESGGAVAVADYNSMRVVIPVDETVTLENAGSSENSGDIVERQSKIIGNMLGAEIDFIIKGIDNKTRSIVASRKEAMLRKRQMFYFKSGNSKRPKIYANRVVQARVLAVAEKGLRVEVFGAECSVYSRNLSHEWIGDARDRYNIGDKILVKVTDITGDTAADLSIKADIKGVLPDTTMEDLKKCKLQGKYAGKVIDIYKGTVFIRLGVGVNAIAHSCHDERMPGKKDDVSFVVTNIDEETRVAIGTITKIIRQNV